jgi:hypothetical protein
MLTIGRHHQGANAALKTSPSSRCKCNPRLACVQNLRYMLDRVAELFLFANEKQVKPRGFVRTGVEIVKRETPLGLYKGLGAVLTGIIPKMAIRFTSYEWYKQALADEDGVVTSKATFMGKYPTNSSTGAS